ncbi:protein of unknown function [Methylacidimicrobium sp. AP8]|nr:protein of unknown function [Methylacidimicrobium sp. AP8]
MVFGIAQIGHGFRAFRLRGQQAKAQGAWLSVCSAHNFRRLWKLGGARKPGSLAKKDRSARQPLHRPSAERISCPWLSCR